MTTFVQYVLPAEAGVRFIPNCTPTYCACAHFSIRTRSKEINEEKERATLENFVDSSILELLFNEKSKSL